MGKTLFKLLLVLVALLLAGRWLLQWEIRNSVDDAIASVRSVVYVNYDRLDVGFDGTVVVKRITLNSNDEDGFNAFIQQIEVDLQSLPELFQRRLGGEPPERMQVRVTGVTANFGNLVETFERDVNCMDPAHQPADWMLGLNQESNLVFTYDYSAENRDLTLDLDVQVPDAYSLNTHLRLGNVAPNLRTAGTLDMVRINYHDVRSIDAWRTFCAKHHELSPEALVTQHVAAIENSLNYQGLSMTEAARSAYENYLLRSGRLKARWVLGVNLNEVPSLEVIEAMLVDRLELELAGTAVSPIFNRVEPKQRVTRTAPLQPKRAAPPPAPVEISFDEAREHIGRTVVIVTGAKEVQGQLLKVGESELVLEVVKDGTNRFSITYYRSRLDRILLQP
ncbi:hypothetical protein [Simiduia aestuariiviva]|uniref:Uncharacterized protein n=1 Tax=Simiduia aestuariiviva TaxID=1510459 RepID=A0A839UP84_9GAMM|nr:hypothetical protein [Simiduia aestuariiviva]MBB3169652.1 hypothetical protein [Simiduia aestuariiviva]